MTDNATPSQEEPPRCPDCGCDFGSSYHDQHCPGPAYPEPATIRSAAVLANDMLTLFLHSIQVCGWGDDAKVGAQRAMFLANATHALELTLASRPDAQAIRDQALEAAAEVAEDGVCIADCGHYSCGESKANAKAIRRLKGKPSPNEGGAS